MKTTFSIHYLAAISLIASVFAVCWLISLNRLPPEIETATNLNETLIQDNSSTPICNLFSGKWVYDLNSSYPLYKGEQCSYMVDSYACEQYGRKDLKFQNWRWQPHHCDLPKFNGTLFMERIREKNVLFVGDSLNHNQWISLICLIESSIRLSSSVRPFSEGGKNIFHANEYNATIGFYWSPLLVESNCDDPDTHRIKERIFRINSIEKHGMQWSNADILIFNSFAWWTQPIMTLLWGSFKSPNAIYKQIEMKTRRYEMALNTWSDWLEININRTKTQMFFMSQSPTHFWDLSTKDNCYDETEPIFEEGYKGFETDSEMMRVAESTIQKLESKGLKVHYLNITQLSDYRKDAHPSIYKKFHHPISEEQQKNPKSSSDCMHWCLPGVPDVWNQILYSYMINS